MELIEQLIARAKANKQRIVLPEGTEERTLKAANQILTDGVADLIILGNVDEIHSLAKQWGLGNIDRATLIDPATSPKKEEYAELLAELRKKKGMTIEEARKKVLDPLYFGCMIIKSGDADGQLAGARNTTGDVLRPALQIIKTAPGITCVSGAMLLLTHAPECGDNGVLVMGGCQPVGSDCRLYSRNCQGSSRYRTPRSHVEFLNQGFSQARSGRQGS